MRLVYFYFYFYLWYFSEFNIRYFNFNQSNVWTQYLDNTTLLQTQYTWHRWIDIIAMQWCDNLSVDRRCCSVLFCTSQSCTCLYLIAVYIPLSMHRKKLCNSRLGEATCSAQLEISLPFCDFSHRAQSHRCGFGQRWKNNHPLSIVSDFLELQ